MPGAWRAAEAPQSEKWEPGRLGLRVNNEEPTWKTSSQCTGGPRLSEVVWHQLVMYGDVYLWWSDGSKFYTLRDKNFFFLWIFDVSCTDSWYLPWSAACFLPSRPRWRGQGEQSFAEVRLPHDPWLKGHITLLKRCEMVCEMLCPGIGLYRLYRLCRSILCSM
jgi:hypothetical protein